jgi:STE24 endopeptidase
MPAAARRALIGAGAAILVAAWVYAATRLWRTSVPGDLSLPSLDPHSFFTQAQLNRASSYESFLRILAVLALVAQLVVLGIYAAKGARFVRESAAGRIGTGMLLGMLGLGFVWFAQIPFGLAGLWWERRHDVSHLGYVTWLIDDFLSVGGQFLFISLALLIVMALAGVWRRRWWLAAAPALVAVSLLFAFVQPYLIPDLHPLRDPAIAADASKLASAEGIPNTPVRVQNTHNVGGAPNAEATGIGPSRRVIIWDTLLRRFREPEVRVVLAHELGHLSQHHILKQLGWLLLLGLPIGLVVAMVTRSRGGLYAPEAVPLAVFAVVAMLFVLTPLQTAFTRRLESEADWVALQTTRDPGAATNLFRRFTTAARAQPDPPGWANVWFGDHPSIMRRIEMAAAWRARNPR